MHKVYYNNTNRQLECLLSEEVRCCARGLMPCEFYKGLAFTTIWLGSKSSQKKMLGGSAKCRAFLNFIMKIKGVAENIDENSC